MISDKVRNAIDNLNGMSADDIANYFRLNGYKGVRGDECNCPVANYLKVNTGNVSYKVNFATIKYARGEMFNPPALANFIMYFDMGEYPDLEAYDD